MKLLALDLTSDRGSIALLDGAWLDGDDVLEEYALPNPGAYADTLFQEVVALLGRHGATVHDIEGIAVATGPGAFTGVRVGVTAAMSLAHALDRRAVAVSNLRAVASLGSAKLRAPIIDARRGDIFVAVYDDTGALIEPEQVVMPDRWSPPEDAEVVDSRELRPLLAAAVGRIGAREFAAGRSSDPAEIDANYVRRSDAELAWTDR